MLGAPSDVGLQYGHDQSPTVQCAPAAFAESKKSSATGAVYGFDQ
eukprot:gene485-754_t